jgi:hypothetical protein
LKVREIGSTSINPGVSNLLETLSNLNSPVLSSAAMVSALEKAPPSDIVQLSAEATQLEGVDAMFGISGTADGSSNSLTSALAGLENAAAGTGNSSSSSASTAAQLSNHQAMVQSDEALALLGGGGSDLTGSSFDLTG